VNGIHALKLTRPSTEPSIRIGVIAAKTSWKYISVDCGKSVVPTSGTLPCPCRSLALSVEPGWPTKLPKKPECESPCQGLPKPIL
jgi:hypothetical protein